MNILSATYYDFLYGNKYHAIDELNIVNEKLKVARKQNKILPSEHDVLRFTKVPVGKIKCVFVGMDPYATITKIDGRIVPVATGRSFEVNGVEKWLESYPQASLRNIFKSLIFLKTGYEFTFDELRIKQWQGNIAFTQKHPKMSDWFDAMEDNGVVFLNAALTVAENSPGSHQKIWEPFMDKVARLIVEQAPDAKWILAGKAAQNRFGNIIPKDNQICCVHPRLSSFVKECPFKKITNIDWV